MNLSIGGRVSALQISQRTRSDREFPLHDLDLSALNNRYILDPCDLAHVSWWESYSLHDLEHVSWIGPVLYSSIS